MKAVPREKTRVDPINFSASLSASLLSINSLPCSSIKSLPSISQRRRATKDWDVRATRLLCSIHYPTPKVSPIQEPHPSPFPGSQGSPSPPSPWSPLLSIRFSKTMGVWKLLNSSGREGVCGHSQGAGERLPGKTCSWDTPSFPKKKWDHITPGFSLHFLREFSQCFPPNMMLLKSLAYPGG